MEEVLWLPALPKLMCVALEDNASHIKHFINPHLAHVRPLSPYLPLSFSSPTLQLSKQGNYLSCFFFLLPRVVVVLVVGCGCCGWQKKQQQEGDASNSFSGQQHFIKGLNLQFLHSHAPCWHCSSLLALSILKSHAAKSNSTS